MADVSLCDPLWVTLDCSGNPGDDCQGFPTASTNVSVISAALQSQGVVSVAADAIAAGACRSFELAQSSNTNFLLFSAYLVYCMQAGFAMLCAGSVRSKNTMNILLKNVLDACVGSLSWYVLGYGIAYQGSGPGNGFIGTRNFCLNQLWPQAGVSDPFLASDWASFLFQWAFAAATATIVSGSVAERTSILAYLLYAIFLIAWVYPVVVHWVWDSYGWLSAFNANPILNTGMIDFAGSGVVHMTGGISGLWGAIFVGPRVGRFDADGNKVDMPGHSATLVVLGTFLLWFGWYGFNPGSFLSIDTAVAAEVVGRVAVTTTLSAGTAGTVTLLFRYYLTGQWNLIDVCNGLLAGLVSVTGPCAVLEPWAAIICGGVGAIIFVGSSVLLVKLKIDDPLEAFPMHGCCGCWGIFYTGLMAAPHYVAQAYNDGADHGIFYGQGTQGRLLACQVIGIAVIIAWVTVHMAPFFYLLSRLGVLRVKPSEELVGLDVSKHGGHAYYGDDSSRAAAENLQLDNFKASQPTI